MHALRTDAPWGLARISSPTKLTNQNHSDLTFSYDYDSTGGANSDIYVLGTCFEFSTFRYKSHW